MAKACRHTVTACVLAFAAFALNGCAQPRGGGAHAPLRVVYVSYVAHDDDSRVRFDYLRLEQALARQAHRPARPIELDFAQVAGDGGPEPIRALVRHVATTRPDVIVASSTLVLEAARAEARSIPVVFVSHEDPVRLGYVRAIARPGVNCTGFTFYVPIVGKSLELLRDAYPRIARVGVVADRWLMDDPGFVQELAYAADELHIHVQTFVAGNARELRDAVAAGRRAGVDAWYVTIGDLIWNDGEAAAALLAATKQPVMYNRTFLARLHGGLSYEARLVDPFAIWARQLALIASGMDAGAIPVERPSAFELAADIRPGLRDPRLMPDKRVLRRADVIFGAQ